MSALRPPALRVSRVVRTCLSSHKPSASRFASMTFVASSGATEPAAAFSRTGRSAAYPAATAAKCIENFSSASFCASSQGPSRACASIPCQAASAAAKLDSSAWSEGVLEMYLWT